MLRNDDISAILDECRFGDWEFALRSDDDRPYLQVEFNAPCTTTGAAESWRSRKWFLSRHMTKSEIVQTAFKAVLTAVEHETRERFRYCGEAIFGPHFDVDSLVDLCRGHHLDVRSAA